MESGIDKAPLDRDEKVAIRKGKIVRRIAKEFQVSFKAIFRNFYLPLTGFRFLEWNVWYVSSLKPMRFFQLYVIFTPSESRNWYTCASWRLCTGRNDCTSSNRKRYSWIGRTYLISRSCKLLDLMSLSLGSLS